MNAHLGTLVAGATLVVGTMVTPGPVSAAGRPPQRKALTVTVQNDRPVPVDVYLEQGALDLNLGSVQADREGVLALPTWLDRDEDVRILIHPTEGLDLESPDLEVPVSGTIPVLVPLNNTGWRPQPRDMIPNPGKATTITVDNQRDQAVDVYVERGEFDTDLGTVEPLHFRTFDLPKALAREEADVQVYIHPKAGFDMASQYFLLKPHDHLEVKVPKN